MAQHDENWAVTQLLKAEQEANSIIKEAEEERSRKLNMARESAQQMIDEFKLEEHSKYQTSVAQKFQNDGDDDQLEQQTKKEIEQIQAEYAENKQKVITSLMDQIFNVKIDISETVKQAIATQYAPKK